MCPRILCPFVSSTRNIALGSASATVPSISIAPSLLAKRVPTSLLIHGVRRSSLKAVPQLREIGGKSVGNRGYTPTLDRNLVIHTRISRDFASISASLSLGKEVADLNTQSRQLGLAPINGGKNERFSIRCDCIRVFKVCATRFIL